MLYSVNLVNFCFYNLKKEQFKKRTIFKLLVNVRRITHDTDLSWGLGPGTSSTLSVINAPKFRMYEEENNVKG